MVPSKFGIWLCLDPPKLGYGSVWSHLMFETHSVPFMFALSDISDIPKNNCLWGCHPFSESPMLWVWAAQVVQNLMIISPPLPSSVEGRVGKCKYWAGAGYQSKCKADLCFIGLDCGRGPSDCWVIYNWLLIALVYWPINKLLSIITRRGRPRW